MGKSASKTAGRLFSLLPISANQITVLSVLLAFLGFASAFLGQHLLALCLFVLSGAADAIDGAVARFRNEASARGAYIDGISDRLVEFAFLCSFLAYSLPAFPIPALYSVILFLFFGSCMTGFATAYADHRKVADSKKISLQPGFLPRAERLILLFIAFALIPFAPYLTSFLLFAGALLCALTFFQRFAYFASK